ncbi:glycosyltransferase family 2 protein, partial [bacterium]|nr:glycosyltransferase family 2 protein [bacterium]
IMLLNQDTQVTEGYLDKLVEEIASDEKISAVQPKILLYPETDKVNSLGNVIHYLGFGYTFGHKELDKKSLFKSRNINYCSGAACLYKVSVLKKVGLFYDELFMYHEDLDLGWRMKLLGYNNIVAKTSVVYHSYEFSRSIKKYYYMERNRFIVMFQNYKLGTILLILPVLVIMEMGLLLFSLSNGFFKEKLRVYKYFLKRESWQKLNKKRIEVQSNRILNDQQVVKRFSGEILHQEVKSNLLNFINPLFDLYWQVVKRLIIW